MAASALEKIYVSSDNYALFEKEYCLYFFFYFSIFFLLGFSTRRVRHGIIFYYFFCINYYVNVSLVFCALFDRKKRRDQMLNDCCHPITEAIARRCSVKKVFLKISKNARENTFSRVSFLIKLQS